MVICKYVILATTVLTRECQYRPGYTTIYMIAVHLKTAAHCTSICLNSCTDKCTGIYDTITQAPKKSPNLDCRFVRFSRSVTTPYTPYIWNTEYSQ